MTEARKNLLLAAALSAGAHLIAMMTLDLSPGSWRHGMAPALRVSLKAAEPSLDGLGTAPAARPARKAERAAGLSAPAAREGSSLPIGERYYRNSEVDVQAVPITSAPLVYPELPYVSRLAGTVKARVFISETGEVESVEIVEARPRRGVFDEAAIDALRQMRYQPALLAGQPVRTQKLIEVKFDPYDDGQQRN